MDGRWFVVYAALVATCFSTSKCMMYEDNSENEMENNDYVINDDEGNDYALVRIDKRPRRRNADFYLRAPKKRSGFNSNGNDWWGYQDLLMNHWPRVGEHPKLPEDKDSREKMIRMLEEAKKAEEVVKANRWLLKSIYSKRSSEASKEEKKEPTSAERRKERQREAARQFYFRPPRSSVVRKRRSANPNASSGRDQKRLLSPTPLKMRSKFDVLAIKGKRSGIDAEKEENCMEGKIWRGTVRRCVPDRRTNSMEKMHQLQDRNSDMKQRKDLLYFG